MNDEAKKMGATNPYKIMARMLDAEVQGRKFRFEGIKTTENTPASGSRKTVPTSSARRRRGKTSSDT